jgi:3-oxoadipate enol-lactonase/4-carboxymuconolactone decarboxylase
MPSIAAHPVRIQWRLDGNPELPALVLGNALGTDIGLWDEVMPRLLRHFYVLRYDARGHGASETPAVGWTLDELADDLAAVISAAGLHRYHYCGISVGGMTGLAYAARQPAGLLSLTLAQMPLQFEAAEVWPGLARTALDEGMAALVERMSAALFTPTFAAHAGLSWQRWRTAFLQQDAAGFAHSCHAIGQADLTLAAGRVNVPTLVTAGKLDWVVPMAAAERVAYAIGGAVHEVLPGAHLAVTETPVAFIDALLAFALPHDGERTAASAARGDARRRQILGGQHVDASQARATAFTTPFQSLITRYAWDEIWSSSRIDDLNRRLLTMMATLASGRWEEYELHVAAALRVGIEWQLIQDLLMQSAIYCGVPTANTGFKLALRILTEYEHGQAAQNGA